MENKPNDEQDLGERYCSILKGHYERLKEEQKKSGSRIAVEEVKLRLFLSLLDRPTSAAGADNASASL